MRSLFFTLSFLFLSLAMAAQPVVSSYLVRELPQAQMQRIADEFEVTRRQGNAYEVFVPQQRQGLFLQLAPRSVLMKSDISSEVRRVYQANRNIKSRAGGYHSFQEVVQTLQAAAAAYPQNTQLVTYGKSKLGKPLLALRVSSQLRAALPRVVLTAATHGDEIITTEVLLGLMNTLLVGSTNNPRLAAILNKIEVVFIPVVNPDGFSEQNRYDNGVDPNRSYPWPDKPNAVPTASIGGLMAFAQAYPMAGSLDFHAYGKMVMYPWAYTYDPVAPDVKQVFDRVVNKMAATNGYKAGQISKVIYVAKGSSADYYFWKHRSLSVAVEMGNSKSPNSSEFPNYTREQTESTWVFLESFMGARR